MIRPAAAGDIARYLDNAITRIAEQVAAIEAGVDPTALVAAMNTAQAEKAAAEVEIKSLPQIRTLTETEIRKLIESLGDVKAVLTAANPIDKAQLYRALELEVRYHPDKQCAIVGVTPCGVSTGVRRGYRPVRQRAAIPKTAGHQWIAVSASIRILS
ncbi:hypothetical protein [Nocardia arizonensis]|uniref:hypothetical protein n=1 Tax=Nocardia arizonensis TaxID=1141647 RepID=UPI0006CFA991|nr:hypothetical protein [Nocardia arizonensis]